MLKSVFLIVPLLTLIVGYTVQAQAIPNLSVSDRQRLSRDLIPSSSQDFFNQGRNQLEQEIRLLERRFATKNEPELKIDPAVQNRGEQQRFRSIQFMQQGISQLTEKLKESLR